MTTTTSATASATTAATNALLTSLGTGSGVDTASLVSSLVQAQFAAKTAALTAKNDALTAQISAASTLKSTISNFSTALQTLVKGGSLTTQPVSSNPNAITATALPGAKASSVSSSITVKQLAAGQTAVTKATVDPAADLGKGKFTLSVGTATTGTDANKASYFSGVTPKDASGTVTIDFSTGGTITDLAKAINAAKTGVTATVITDANGQAYLSLKGQSGSDNAFSLTASGTDQAKLAKFDVGGTSPGTDIVTTAQNAKLVVDGAQVERSSNAISDLVAGVKLQFGAVTTTPVTLSTTPPTAALTQAVTDFVDTYNEVAAAVKAQTDAQTGPLKSDSAANTLLRSLRALTTTKLVLGAADGDPTTLAGIGVRTNRDGSLQIDSAALTKALTDAPDAVEAIFAYSSGGIGGLSSALDKVTTTATSVVFGLGASVSRYTAQQTDVGKKQDDLADQSAALTTRLTQQYASLNSKISAYKSTQTFLDNQIKAWNKSDS